jgi:sialate O-acetylesterase
MGSVLFLPALLFAQSPGAQSLELPAIFGDHMVLQSGMEPPVWGRAKPLSKIVVQLNQQQRVFIADTNGAWNGRLPELVPGKTYRLIISSGKEKLIYDDVLSGDVFYAGGQSNMQYSLKEMSPGNVTAASATNNKIRLFTVPRDIAYRPRFDINKKATENELEGKWQICSPETAADFSAVAYFFAQRIQQTQNIPVGIINVSWGGTPVEAHTSLEGNRELPYNSDLLKEIGSKTERDSLTIDKKKAVPQLPASVFNAMIHPLIPYGLKGFLWYQGEQNWNTPFRYRYQFATFINDLRIRWKQGYLPFYFVQLPNIGKKSTNPSTEDFLSVLRESQLQALRLPNTGMVVGADIGDGDLHPKDKKPFGERLAALALRHIYKNSITSEGPLLNNVRIVGDTVVLSFDYAASGLLFKGDTAKGFAIASADKKFYWAQATIREGKVWVHSAEVKNPKAVRYGWGENPDVSLFNKEGWPASPFRTDDWTLREDGRW